MPTPKYLTGKWQRGKKSLEKQNSQIQFNNRKSKANKICFTWYFGISVWQCWNIFMNSQLICSYFLLWPSVRSWDQDFKAISLQGFFFFQTFHGVWKSCLVIMGRKSKMYSRETGNHLPSLLLLCPFKRNWEKIMLTKVGKRVFKLSLSPMSIFLWGLRTKSDLEVAEGPGVGKKTHIVT